MAIKDYLHPPAIVFGFAAVLIGSSLAVTIADDAALEAAVITFVVTASGIELFGIGAAFWGLVAGGATQLILHRGKSA